MVNNINVSEVVKGMSVSDIFRALPPEFLSKIDLLITIAKAIGVLFIIYLVLLSIRWISDFLRNRRIKKIYNKVNEIDEKLDRLLERKNRKGIKKTEK